MLPRDGVNTPVINTIRRPTESGIDYVEGFPPDKCSLGHASLSIRSYLTPDRERYAWARIDYTDRRFRFICDTEMR